MTDKLHTQGATQLAAQIRNGQLGAREALEYFLARVDRFNPALNAIVVDDREGARAQADAADAARARGALLGPLHGVPMTIKESFDLSGYPSTWGLPELREHKASVDAVAVQRLKAAGAVIFGKTNVPLRLADFQSYNEVYGTTENPWRHGRTPGGSSGGSAAAVAAGLTGLDIGSDIGGSIRNPAHYCGVFGHKPTWNLAPLRGHAMGGGLTPTDISVIGPLARTAEDLQTQLHVIGGPDLLDAPGLKLKLDGLAKPTSELRVAVWADDAMCPVSAAVQDRVRVVAAALAAQGAQLDDAARPEFSSAHSHGVFQALLTAAMSGRMPDADFAAAVLQAQSLEAADESPLAHQLRAQTMRARDWQRLNEQRTRLRWAWHRFFERFDFLLMPIMSTTAFAHDHGPFGQRRISIDGVDHPYFGQTFWAGLPGVSYLPATVVPTGPGPDGLPIGVQIVGPAWGDLRTIQLAQRLEALGFAFSPPPGFD